MVQPSGNQRLGQESGMGCRRTGMVLFAGTAAPAHRCCSRVMSTLGALGNCERIQRHWAKRAH